MSIKIVTDSTCDLPATVVETYGITVVPVYVNTGAESHPDTADLRQNFYQNLMNYETYPTTAAPASGTFAEVYDHLLRNGASEILSIHLSANLSATYNAARLGAEAVDPNRIKLFDSRQITIGTGWQVQAAAEAAFSGQSSSEIMALLENLRPRVRIFGMLDNLESLRRSGRVNWAQFGIGTLLQIKPVLMIYDGQINVVAKVRTRKRSTQHMVNLVKQLAPFERLAVLHVNAPEAALALAEEARTLLDDDLPVMEVGPAIGVHLGLGAIGFACVSRDI
ncbi:MAG: DegV family protein [Chloroflexi bacterium]|nr:MAG: DegV family protein [Chloroflexota bacterium]